MEFEDAPAENPVGANPSDSPVDSPGEQAGGEPTPPPATLDSILENKGDFTGTITQDVINNLRAERGQGQSAQRQIAELKQREAEFEQRLNEMSSEKADEMFRHKILGSGLELDDEAEDEPMTKTDFANWQKQQSSEQVETQQQEHIATFVSGHMEEFPNAEVSQVVFEAVSRDELTTMAEIEDAILSGLRNSQADFQERAEKYVRGNSDIRGSLISDYKDGKFAEAQAHQQVPAVGQQTTEAATEMPIEVLNAGPRAQAKWITKQILDEREAELRGG